MIEEIDKFLSSSENRNKLFQTKDFKKFRSDSMVSKQKRILIGLVVMVMSAVPFSIAYLMYITDGGKMLIPGAFGVMLIMIGILSMTSENPSEERIRDSYLETIRWEMEQGKIPDMDKFLRE